MTRIAPLLFLLLLPSVCFGLENELVRQSVDGKGTAEVEPGKFIEYEEHIEIWDLKYTSFAAVHALKTKEAKYYQRNTTYLSISWQGQDLFWVGVGVPICLRSDNKVLYLVVFDRDSDFSYIRFRYYRQDHSVLAEITPKEFPKEIAVQNLWLKKENGFHNDGKPINEIEIAKNLDPEDSDFQQSLTAKMWMQLETGKEFYETEHDPVPAEFLKEFLKNNKVKKLQSIVNGVPQETQGPIAEPPGFDRAKSLQQQEKYEEAIREFQKFAEANKGSRLVPYALYETGMCYRLMKRNAEALAAYQRLADQCPGSEPAKWAQTEMETLKRMIEASPEPQPK